MKNLKNIFKEIIHYLNSIYISTREMTLILVVLALAVGSFLVIYSSLQDYPTVEIKYESPIIKEEGKLEPFKSRPKPGPVSMKKMKTRGCVADGVLSGYGGDIESSIELINRSECIYLHRAIETWLSPPDFALADQLMSKFTKPNMIYGMFIAEAINKKAKLFYPEENRYFDFDAMCRGGSDNVWGEHTCKPSFEKKEYQKYLQYITHQAMDLGIQSFLFGQIYYQDTPDLSKSEIPEILSDMRSYAKEKDIQIVIGAQTGHITDEKYLRRFDYIEGGVGLGSDGSIENGACLSWRSGCWALLWHDDYAKKANNVLLHLDWTGIKSDDMSTFARMDKETREKTLKNLYNYFSFRQMGFLMPFSAALHRQNGGCHGPKKRFYSPDNKYTCQDEESINRIFSNYK